MIQMLSTFSSEFSIDNQNKSVLLEARFDILDIWKSKQKSREKHTTGNHRSNERRKKFQFECNGHACFDVSRDDLIPHQMMDYDF